MTQIENYTPKCPQGEYFFVCAIDGLVTISHAELGDRSVDSVRQDNSEAGNIAQNIQNCAYGRICQGKIKKCVVNSL